MRRLGLGLTLGFAMILINVACVASEVLLDNYSIKVSASPTKEAMIAFAEFDVMTGAEAGLDSLCFFLHDELEVNNVCDTAGNKFKFSQSRVSYTFSYSLAANKICVRLTERLAKGDTLRLTVLYTGKFTQSATRSAADFMRLNNDGLFLRGPGCSLWFPTTAATLEDINATAGFDVEVQVPPAWKVLSEGELLSSRVDKSASFRWVTDEKIPVSAAVLIASDYDTLSTRVGRQKISFWRFSSAEDSTASVKLFEAAKELLGFFIQNYGDNEGASSPPRFTMVEMPIYGDFFSGTVMGISEGRIREAVSSQKRAELASLIASKMVRKFAVPAVDSSAPGAAFLLESVPSYAYVPAIEAVFGRPFVLESSDLVMRNYVEGRRKAESREPGFPPEKPLAELLVSEIPRYKDTFLLGGRGAFVLHMLRRLIGDESFSLVIRSYMAAFADQPRGGNLSFVDRPAGGNASFAGQPAGGSASFADRSAGGNASVQGVNRIVTKRARLEDFMQIAEAASGKRLDWFFSEWLYGDVLPDYRIAEMKVSASRDTTFVDVKVENTGTGLMPVPVTLFTDKGQRTSEVWLAAHESAQMRFASRSKPKRVEIDPQKWILQADISNDGEDIALPETGKK